MDPLGFKLSRALRKTDFCLQGTGLKISVQGVTVHRQLLKNVLSMISDVRESLGYWLSKAEVSELGGQLLSVHPMYS